MSRSLRATTLIALITSAVTSALGSPIAGNGLVARQDPQNVVYITNTVAFCMIMPRDPHTNIGDSEHPGGMKTYCSPVGYDPQQGQLPSNFWRSVEFKTGNGPTGGRYVQLTGCINPGTVDRLNTNDAGGQYDSSGGVNGTGNPQGSVCLGYNHYVELVEPLGPRACIRCCDNPSDCPTNQDTLGCPTVIPGNYFDCSL